MPNHVYNIVTVDGDERIVRLLAIAVRSEQRPFDFSRIIPLPPIVEAIDLDGRILNTGPEHVRRNWNDWGVANWGTKWNACDCEEVAPGRYEFYTDWGPPIPVVRALSTLFPELTITLTCQEDGVFARVVFENGEIVDGALD